MHNTHVTELPNRTRKSRKRPEILSTRQHRNDSCPDPARDTDSRSSCVLYELRKGADLGSRRASLLGEASHSILLLGDGTEEGEACEVLF